jgi:hypothetical protein
LDCDYRFYSHDRFDEEAVFDLVRRVLEGHLQPKAPLVVAMDDSLLRKTGRHIHGVRYLRDPLSPPFNVNLVRGLRVLQCSAALPDGTGAARMVPVDFQHAVLPQKPAKNATMSSWRLISRNVANATSTAWARSALNCCASRGQQR